MCWIAIEEKDRICRVAENDIRIFKIVDKIGDSMVYTPYYWTLRETYSLGWEYYTKMGERILSKGGVIVDRGFHSYSKKKCFVMEGMSCYNVFKKGGGELWNSFAFSTEGKTCVLWGIVPKGSRYYENADGEIVSDHLIIKNEIEKENLASSL